MKTGTKNGFVGVLRGIAAGAGVVAFGAAALADSSGKAVSVASEFGDPDVVRATFVEPAAGVSDNPGGAKAVKEVPVVKERVYPSWDRKERKVPAELSAAPFPSYYVYEGAPVTMALDGTRIAVRFRALQPGNAAVAIAGLAGVGAVSAQEPAIRDGWQLLTLAVPAKDAGAVDAMIRALAALPEVAFASPVFHHPRVEGGYMVVTDALMARVAEANVGKADVLVRDRAPELAVTEMGFGGMPGAVMTVSASRNGFDVLRVANALSLDADFAWAEPNFLQTAEMHFVPNEPNFNSIWGIRQNNGIDCNADLAWDVSRGSSAVEILVMDCGVEQDHPDISQNAGRDFTVPAIPAGFGTGDPAGNCDRHGTSVAGIVSSRINNGIGSVGVAPGCRSLSARTAVEDTNPCASTYASFSSANVVNALAWGEAQGATVSNASFSVGVSAAITDAYAQAWANGMIHFASAGNGGGDQIGDANLAFPSELPTVQSVAALDTDGTLTSFSNFGPGLDFAMPGTGCYTADRQGSLGYSGTDYTNFGGTSAASPFAAGAAALIWSVLPHLTASELLTVLRNGTRDLGVGGYDQTFGYGLIDTWEAITDVGVSNDYCATARVISSSALSYSNSFSTVNATAFAGEPQANCELDGEGEGHSVWYEFTPSCGGSISVNTNGSSYDTVLSVWTGTCGQTMTIRACDDDGGTGTQSQVLDEPVTAGTTYYIKVSAYGSNAGGTLDFNFEYAPAVPANDLCSNATVIAPATVLYNPAQYCTKGATTSICEAAETCESGASGVSNSVWYEFTPSTTGRATIHTIGSDYDTVLSVHTGCGFFTLNGCVQGVQIACDDDISVVNTDSQITGLVLQAGTTYRIKVADYDTTSEGGDLDFNMTYDRCLADWNNNNVVEVGDIFAYLSDWFDSDPAASVDNQAGVAVSDIFAFLSAWFAGC